MCVSVSPLVLEESQDPESNLSTPEEMSDPTAEGPVLCPPEKEGERLSYSVFRPLKWFRYLGDTQTSLRSPPYSCLLERDS